jgi:dihydroorotase
MIGLQTSFAAVYTAIPELSPERLVELFSTNARRIFNIKATINIGEAASLTLFEINRKWTYTESLNHSRSVNSPYLGKVLNGRPFGIIHKDRLFLNGEL